MILNYRSILLAYLSLLAAAKEERFIIELKEGLNAASLLTNAEDPLMRVIGPFVKEKISIGAFNCLVADLEVAEAKKLRGFAGIKRIMPDVLVRAFDDDNTPLDPQYVDFLGTEGLDLLLPGEQTFKVQIEDPGALIHTDATPKSAVPTSPEKNVTARSVQEDAPSHLARVSERQGLYKSETPSTYTYDYSGAGIYAYVLDSGVAIEHPDFEGRAIRGANFVRGEAPGDLHGHGTHVAGLIGSKTYGVAKEVTIVEVKGLDARGGGSMSTILQSMEWAAKDRQEKEVKGVLNMSLGGFYYAILNDATDAVVKSGMPTVVAAGNDRSSASLFSPASSKEAITVGAMDAKKDTVAWFSNFGEGVNVFAPGFEVASLNARNFDSPVVFSGTSMASPITAGVVALYLEEGVLPEEMQQTVVERSTKGALAKSLKGSWKYYSTHDRVLFSGSDSTDTETTSTSPFTREDVTSQTVMPSFGQLTQSALSIEELSYELI